MNASIHPMIFDTLITVLNSWGDEQIDGVCGVSVKYSQGKIEIIHMSDFLKEMAAQTDSRFTRICKFFRIAKKS